MVDFRIRMEHTTVVSGRSGIVQVTERLVIKDLVEVMAGVEPGRAIESHSFMLGDIPMKIKVYPNGDGKDKNNGHVGVYLRNIGDGDIRVKCQFITDAKTLGFDYKDGTVKANNYRGFGTFLTHADCTDAYMDKDFVVTAKVEIPGEFEKIASQEVAIAPRKGLDVWENVYSRMQKTDFVLVFDGKEVPCHKHILAAASPVFEAMVENQHKEAIECKANIELSEEVGRAFVRFIYTGEVHEDVMKEHASAFLALGELYNMKELKNLAEAELLIQLDKENMVAMLSIGEVFRADDILEAALKMTKVHMTWLRSQVVSTLGMKIY